MRMVVVAGLLMLALLGAVLGSVGAPDPAWVSARDNVGASRGVSGFGMMAGSLTPG